MKQHRTIFVTGQLLAALILWVGIWHPGGGFTLPMANKFSLYPLFNELKTVLEDVPAATASRYDAKDSAGHTMDTAKIIADPAGGYMAIYHTDAGPYFQVHLATSTDLMHWQYRQSYGLHTHQPYLAASPDGGFVLANEADGPHGNWIQVRYYRSRADLLANHPLRSFDVPHTQVPADHLAEGTPNIYSIALNPDIDHSSIDIGFHYFKDGISDRQARGTLVDFSSWSAKAQPRMDQNLLDFGVQGNIGDRDQVTFRGDRFLISEGQFAQGDFGSWRVFLTNEASNQVVQLNVRTQGGSQAFANPTLSLLPSPHGGQALVVTYYIPADHAAPGEAGELIFYHDIGTPQDEG